MIYARKQTARWTVPYVKGVDRNQTTLFPESIDDYIASDNAVRVIDAYVEQLDMVKLNFNYAKAPGVGRPPYNPKALLKLYLYGYLNRTRSSRRLEHETKRNVEVIWLLEKQQPDFKTIADFRKNNKKALKEIFKDFNNLCKKWELYGKETVAIDGSKFKASNSKKNNYNKKKLERQKKYLDEKIDRYLKELDENDELEKADRKPSAEEIEKRIEELKNRKTRFEDLEKELETSGQNEISTSDPDARLMSNGKGGVEVSYNVQTTVDAKHKLICDFEVTNEPNDSGKLSQMALRTKEILEVDKIDALADKGYFDADCLKTCVENEIRPYVSKQKRANGTGNKNYFADRFRYVPENDHYICPAGVVLARGRARKDKNGELSGYDYGSAKTCKGCPVREHCTKSANGRRIHRHKEQDFLDSIALKSKEDYARYKQRQMIVEHPFGTIKRGWDAAYFLTRGIESVTTETALTYLAYNLRRAINILGVEELVQRLQESGKPVLV